MLARRRGKSEEEQEAVLDEAEDPYCHVDSIAFWLNIEYHHTRSLTELKRPPLDEEDSSTTSAVQSAAIRITGEDTVGFWGKGAVLVLRVILAVLVSAQVLYWNSAITPFLRTAQENWKTMLVPLASMMGLDESPFATPKSGMMQLTSPEQIVLITKQFVDNYFLLTEDFVESYHFKDPNITLSLEYYRKDITDAPGDRSTASNNYILSNMDYGPLGSIIHSEDLSAVSARFLQNIRFWKVSASVLSYELFHIPIEIIWNIAMTASFFDDASRGELAFSVQKL